MNGITIVAEVACAHEGNLDSLFEMIEVAGRVQVDAIQFQFFQAGENAIEGQPKYDIAVQLELPLESYSEIFRRSRAHSLNVWATVGDVVSAEEANKYSPEVWRIHSGDINNITLIEYLCETNIPIVFSVGGSTLEEIEYAINYTREHGGEVNALIHGFQGYPTPIDEAVRIFDRDEIIQQVEKNVRLYRFGKTDFASQAPGAYKKICDVFGILRDFNLAEPVVRLRPLATLKA